MFENKNILITGGLGMIGRSLINILEKKNCNITVADISNPKEIPKNITYKKVDLRYFDQCIELCQKKDFIFNLVGIKGSPKVAMDNPADFMVPMLQFNTNMMEAARLANVEWYLYTSSVGVYAPSERFFEDSVWKTFPSPNDKYAGWAKRIGELQAEAYSIQYKWNKVSIVRPANVYGPYDNFDMMGAMVIPSLIRKAHENSILEVWGDGSQIRDFIYSEDVALGMILAIENKITEPINLGSGVGHSIKDVVNSVVKYSQKKPKVKWLTDKPSGDKIRLFDMQRSNKYGFYSKTNLDMGIKFTTNWFLENLSQIDKRFNPF